MKNVTVSMDEATLAEARIRAATIGKSLSRYLADLVSKDVSAPLATPQTSKESKLAALERILSGPKWSVMQDGRMPTSDERNER